MKKQIVIPSAWTILSIGLGIFIGVLPNAYPNISHKTWVNLIYLGIVVISISGIWPLWILYGNLKEKIPPIFKNYQLQWPVSPRKTPIPINMALYAGHFFADFKKLREENFITFFLTLFNHTDDIIFIEGIQGKIKLNEFTTYPLNVDNDLLLKVIPHSHDGCQVVFQQRFTPEEASKIIGIIEAGKSISFDFREIKLRMHKNEDPSELVTLYNFHGIACSRPESNAILASRVVFLEVRDSVQVT